jgi:hypothetical protein
VSAAGRDERQARRHDVDQSAARSSVDRVSSSLARVRWDAQQHPVALLRNARGQLLGFVRGGDVRVPGSEGVEVVLPSFMQ